MSLTTIQNKIYEIRGQKVMIDADLAELYEVETKRLKEAVRRNIERFPEDFMFELTRDEYNSLRTQIASLEIGRGKYSKYLPFAFTEQGVAMLSGVLKSQKAVEANIAIMRAFVAIRHFALTYKELAQKLAELEEQYNMQFGQVYKALNLLLKEKQDRGKWKDRKRIGFKAK
jgi:hypothetical protein